MNVAKVGKLMLVIGALVVTPALWPNGRTIAQRPDPTVAAQVRQMSRNPKSLPSNALRDWGSTYYALEGRASRVEAHFPNAVVRSERKAQGDVVVEMTTSAGVRVAGGAVTARASANGTLAVDGPHGRRTVPLQARVKATLDWVSIQSYLLADESGSLVVQNHWRDGFVRNTDVADIPDDKPLRLSTEFGGGLRATTYRRSANVQEAMKKGTPYFTTVLTRGDEGLGTMHWHPGLQMLTWHFPGLTNGQMTAQTLDQAQAGWTFTPTLAWANVQALAFFEMHSKKKAEQLAGNRPDCQGPSSPAMLAQRAFDGALEFMSPALQANDPGCDFLHWLDNTVYRPCCDEHDRCYSKYGCNYFSWFLPSVFVSWECEMCNGSAALCFATGNACEWDPGCECRQQGGWYDPVMAYCFEEPIVIKLGLNSEHVQLSAPEDGVFFDTNGRGTPQKISWTLPRSDVGFLVLDRNGNGTIDDGTEWFGNNTPMSDGSRAAHGFVGLRDLDGGERSDGAVTKDDPWYWQLRVWLDRNHNGVSEPAELVKLEAAGIEALATDYRQSTWIDRHGNVYPFAADVTFRRDNGLTVVRPMYDALLQRAE